MLRVINAVTGVLHELQKERCTTVIFLASDGRRFEAELAERRADMDHAFLSLITSIDDGRSVVMAAVAAERQQVIDIMERLPEVRAQVDARALGADAAIDYYTDLNQALLLALGSASVAVPSQAQRSALVALLALSRAKELAGIERAVLAQVFARDRFGRGHAAHLAALLAGQEALLRIFDQLTTEKLRDEHARLQAHPAVVRAHRLETRALANGTDDLEIDPAGWFMAMTQRIDLLRTLERSQLVVAEGEDAEIDEHEDAEINEALQAAVEAMRELRGLVDRVQDGEASLRELMRGQTDALGSVSRQLAASRRTAERMATLAVSDPLTGLPNRSVVNDLVRDALARAVGTGVAAVLTLDLDHFKIINDSMGHRAGDRLLVAVAQRLSSALRSTDTIARIGGDEFLVVLEPVAGIAEACMLAERLLREVRRPMDLDGAVVRASMSIGVASSELGDGADDLVQASDMAAYEAKRLGRDRVVAFDAELRRSSVRRHAAEQRLRRDLEFDELPIRRIPLVDRRGQILAVDVRVDMAVEDRSVAVAAGLETRIVGQLARRATASWIDDSDSTGVLLRLGRASLAMPSLIDAVLRAAEVSGLSPSDLWIAVSEAGVRSSSNARAQLDRLAARGCVIVLDEFGTAASSMRALWDLPVHFVRLDLEELPDDALRPAMLAATIDMAAAAGMGVIAGGVDDLDTARRLFDLGLAGVQGIDPASVQSASTEERPAEGHHVETGRP